MQNIIKSKANFKSKNIVCMIISAIMLFSLVSCTSKGVIDFKVEDLTSKMVKELKFVDELTNIEFETAKVLYGLGNLDVEISAYTPSGATAEEIVVIKAKSATDATLAQEKMQSYQNSQITQFSSYNPPEVEKLNAAIIDIHGNYVVYCATDDVDTARTLISRFITENTKAE